MTRAIKQISVHKLFGRYDYKIPVCNPGDTDTPRVRLLYGDNGTGKTTILELVFHLLSASDNRGHRSYVARTPFQRFDIVFTDNSRITASRHLGELLGSFDLEVAIGGGKPQSARLDPDPETGSIHGDSISPETRALIDKASELELDVFYLGDNRALEGDSIPRREWRRHRGRTLRLSYDTDDRPIVDDPRLIVHDPQAFATESTLADSILRTEQTLNREVMRASSAGETDARQVYADILNTIASASTPEEGELDGEISKIRDDLYNLGSISMDFERFGLGSAINVSALAASLENANTATMPAVVRVLRSFLDGQRARLSALDAIYKVIKSFVENANEYFSDKSIEFDVFDGLNIRLPSGTLSPDRLSSGEQHLLLLFLNVITPSRQPPLFIIDEPELSLNVKWQRNLVDTLLRLSQGSGCQFLMATHSIELLTKHVEHVYKLEP